MRFVKSLFVVLTAVFVIAVAQEVQAQQLDPYVSCVKCHALPMQQARAQMQQHGYGYPPAPEVACANCHDTWLHEQDPNAPPYVPYFWRYPLTGPGSLMTNLCLSCHTVPIGNHPYDVFPYSGTPLEPPPIPPTSVLPLFDAYGWPNQNPYLGGIVCSTCHDPHEPSYSVNGFPAFLRIGSSIEQTAPLCGYCHAESTPMTTGADLVIGSSSDSVRFQFLPYGDLEIQVTVKNRGNVPSADAYPLVFWEDETGYRTFVGSLSVSSIPPEGEAVIPFYWMPPPGWTAGDGFFVFQFPPRPLLDAYIPVEFVRGMDVTPAPTNLRVTNAAPGEISLAWDLPPAPPVDLAWDVYRDGAKITPTPTFSPMHTDAGLAPETPHVYTVVAVRMGGGLPSQPSSPAGGTTTTGFVVRVPQEYPTIQAAINAVGPMTSIHVAAGTYSEQLNFNGKQAITVKGQDANGCVLDYLPGMPGMIDLGPWDGMPGNTLAGFTIHNGSIFMGAGDAVVGCVLTAESGQPPPVTGGGLVAQCVFDTPTQSAVHIDYGQLLTAVNSIFLGPQPFNGAEPPAGITLLLNNDFPNWYDWTQYQGSGNFSDQPLFVMPGPTTEYLPDPASPTVNRGFPLTYPALPELPDVGAFEAGELYTPQPPADLIATFQAVARSIDLFWIPSIDDGALQIRMMGYLIYRSESPVFPPATGMNYHAFVPPGTTWFEDTNLVLGTTYYYQVRAYAGPTAEPLLSAPTNIASAAYANNPPVAVNDAYETPENTPLFVAAPGVLANDGDPDGDPMAALLVAGPSHGTLTLSLDGSFSYCPDPGFSGTDSFTYFAGDPWIASADATVTITVVPVNDPPIALDDAFTGVEDTLLYGMGVLGNDSDPDGDALQAQLVAGTTHGTLTLNPDGSFFYYAAANYNGPDSFTYVARDAQAGSAIATVSITVLPANDLPVPNKQPVTTAEDTPVAVTLSATDIDGDVLTYAVINGPAHGSFSGVVPNLIYTPSAGFNGSDSFTFRASDGQTGADAIVSITVTPVNDLPVASAQAITTAEDTAAAVTLAAADADGDALSYAVVAGPAHGTLSGVAPNLTYTPAPNYFGPDSFTFTANDGQATSAPATVSITVTPVNDPPVAMGDAYGWVEDGSYFTPSAPGVLINDTDVEGGPLSAVLVTGPVHGTVTLNANGSFSYLPPPNFNGPDSFTYRASDGQASSAPVTVSIHVNPVNDPPVAGAQAVTVVEDSSVAVVLTATDVDGNPLTFVVSTGPARGTLSGVAPNLTYTPAPNYFGPDSFAFTANDGLATSAPASVSITVTPVNDPPQTNDDTAATAAYVPVLIAVLGNDTDVDGDTPSVSSAAPGANGSTAVQAGGEILYTPNPGFIGTDSFSYVVDDGNGGTDTAVVTVGVRAQKLRIAALTMATVTSSRYTNATATPLAVDEAGAPLAGVSVGGRWSGLTSDVDTGLTGADGNVTVSSSQVRNANGTFTFTIDTAVKAGYELDGPASVLTNSIQYPAPPPPGGEMHVASIVMGLKTGKNTSATAAVTVVDANGIPVASAAVSGSWSDAVNGTSTGTTGADGKVTLSSAGIKNAAGKTFTLTVTGISKSGWTYDPAANVETGGSITAP